MIKLKTKYRAEREAKHMKKVQRIQDVKRLFSEGYNISQISEKMNSDWKTVKTYIKMENMPNVQRRKSINIATPYLETIKMLALEGFKPKYIHEAITKDGYKGSERFIRYIIKI